MIVILFLEVQLSTIDEAVVVLRIDLDSFIELNQTISTIEMA